MPFCALLDMQVWLWLTGYRFWLRTVCLVSTWPLVLSLIHVSTTRRCTLDLFTRPQDECLMTGKKTVGLFWIIFYFFICFLQSIYRYFRKWRQIEGIYLNNLGHVTVEFVNWYCKSLISDLLVDVYSKNVRQDSFTPEPFGVGIFFKILARPVFKMWILQEPKR